ncbi:MAG: hypothetical protein WC216_10760 [Gallionella sp.]|jgi:hypothetical protein
MNMSHPTETSRLALLLALLFLNPLPLAYGGGVPGASSPTCVKWCGGSESSGNTTSKTRGSHKITPMIDSDIQPMIDAIKAKKMKAKQAEIEAAKAADEMQHKQEAQQRAAAQSQRAAEQAAERIEIQKLGSELKGGLTIEAPNNITLKPIPSAGGLARSQLDCAAHVRPDDNHSNPSEESWESHMGGCAPITPNVPEPPKPTRVDDRADTLAKLLESLKLRITKTRETLKQQEQMVAAKEQEVTRENLNIVEPGKPKGESDALRRALEALAKAKADRERTAAELTKLEQQEQAARNNPPTTQ